MKPSSAFLKWALIGLVASALLAFAQAQELGGPAGMLQVGEASQLRPLIEEALGEVPLVEGPGHDGQIYYAIAIDLVGEVVPDLLDHAGYRYRRIAFPLLASGFGTLGGQEALVGMIVVAVLATSVASGGVAALARARGLSDWWALTVVLNPGVWLSVQLLTADVLAIAGMVLGLLAVSRVSRWQHVGFVGSVLAKDVFIATPLGLSLDRDRRRWLTALVPGVALLGLMIVLSLVIGEGFTTRGNLDWPGLGILEASSNWSAFDPEEWFYLLFALVCVIAGLVYGLVGRSWLRWSMLIWSVLALVSSNWVWDFGNNAARAFAPIVILIGLAGGQAWANETAEDSGSAVSGTV